MKPKVLSERYCQFGVSQLCDLHLPATYRAFDSRLDGGGLICWWMQGGWRCEDSLVEIGCACLEASC